MNFHVPLLDGWPVQKARKLNSNHSVTQMLLSEHLFLLLLTLRNKQGHNSQSVCLLVATQGFHNLQILKFCTRIIEAFANKGFHEAGLEANQNPIQFTNMNRFENYIGMLKKSRYRFL